MHPLDPQTISLRSMNLVEASAGTGKSWTVTLLLLRVLLESDPPIGIHQILVVTFTDAATKELKDKIRERIVEALAAFKDPSDRTIKNEYRVLLERHSDHEQAIKRLKLAQLSLDQAAVFTIHGFCSRVLRDHAFEVSLPFDYELIEDDSEIVLKLVDDYWRRLGQQMPNALLDLLSCHKGITPDFLLTQIKEFIGKPYLKFADKPGLPADTSQTALKLSAAYREMVECWLADRGTIIDLLEHHQGLNKSAYGQHQRQAMFELADALPETYADFLQGHFDNKRLVKFRSDTIKVNKGHDVPQHEFFDKVVLFTDLQQLMVYEVEQQKVALKIALLDYLRVELPLEKQKLKQLSYDDLLLSLAAALEQADGSGQQLAEALRAEYPVAMVDEFQDTDPIQYAIFRHLYLQNRANKESTAVLQNGQEKQQAEMNQAVFLVGDPKQAIYSFRNGDIYTYLKAKDDTREENRFTLEVNWRSHKTLINALNTLYTSHDNPFRDTQINYHKVGAGNRVTDSLKSPQGNSALRFWIVSNHQAGEKNEKNSTPGKINKNELSSQIAESVATDIASQLTLATLGKFRIGDKPISGGDIAILVRTHREGNLIKAALNRHGVASVQSGKETVFQSLQAEELEFLMEALIEPQRDSFVRRALVTSLFGNKATDFAHYETNPADWDKLLGNLFDWHRLWQQQGFMPMLRRIMRDIDLEARLLAETNGERHLTNLLHLAELIHTQSHQHALGPEETLHWYRQQLADPKKDAKSAELRLESDENLVKIVTIHKSKGLEYPIVYCPFVGFPSTVGKPDKPFVFQREGETFVDFGSDKKAVNYGLKTDQILAEDARLLYVALTRAIYQLTVVCFPAKVHRHLDNSALGWLLSNGLTLQSVSTKATKENNAAFYTAYAKRLDELSKHESIHCEAMPNGDATIVYREPDNTDNRFAALVFNGTIKPQARITSFSALTADAHDEAPDHDAQWYAVPHVPLQPDPLDSFPRGATAGSALHEMYENLDFTRPLSEQEIVFQDALSSWGFDQQHLGSAVRMIENSLKNEIDKGFSLSQLSKNKRLNEMEFYLPLKQLKLAELRRLLSAHLPQERNWRAVHEALDKLNFEQVEGFLKGFIDLIFEQDGRFFVVDYKSNSLADYSTASLFDTIADSHYYLQYLLYCVALHRYLAQRVAGYHWDTHVGGVYYLFIRGMQPKPDKKQADGSSINDGVFFHKPAIELIEALDSLFREPLRAPLRESQS